MAKRQRPCTQIFCCAPKFLIWVHAVHLIYFPNFEHWTVCYEVTNLTNERPIGLLPDIDSNSNVLTPNSMLLGRATASNPNVWAPEFLSLKDRCGVVGNVVELFWKYWIQLFAPSLVYQKMAQ